MTATNDQGNQVGSGRPNRDGLFWATVVFLVSSIAMFSVFFVREVLYNVIIEVTMDQDWLWSVLRWLGNVINSIPFGVAYLVMPVIAVGLFIGWKYAHRAESASGLRAATVLEVCAGALGAWAWFISIQFLALNHASIAFEDYPELLITFGLPNTAHRVVTVVAYAAGIAFFVMALTEMLQMTNPVTAPRSADAMGLSYAAEPTSAPNADSPGSKTCPICAEDIKSQALICRYCGYDFRTGQRQGQSPGANGLAIASLVLSLLSLCGVGSLLAVIFGHRAIGQINASGGTQGGKGMAIAGTILGWIGLAGIALWVLLAIGGG